MAQTNNKITQRQKEKLESLVNHPHPQTCRDLSKCLTGDPDNTSAYAELVKVEDTFARNYAKNLLEGAK